MSYAASSIPMPPAAALSDNVRSREFETAFCRDFFCCGLILLDLHDLLQHYEECHVHFEDDNDNESRPSSLLADMDNETSGQDTEFLDDDSWSDTESNYSQSTTESFKGCPRRSGPKSSNGDIQDVTAAALRLKLLAAVKGAEALVPNCTGRALSQMQTALTSHAIPLQSNYQEHRGDSDPTNKGIHNDNITAHAVDALGFGLSNKRKTMVSLADIYTDLDENDFDDINSSAFPNTILRTRAGAAASELLGPLAKRQALESNQRSIAAAILSDKNGGVHPFFQFSPSTAASIYPSNLFAGVAGSISPLATSRVHRPSMLYHSLAPSSVSTISSSSATKNSRSPYVTAAVDLMRQREEVFSILEDMAKPPPNSSIENKPYRCSVLGCDKAYKNPNGLKYHNLHGHCSNGLNDQDGPESKPYVCTFLECGKRYKNLNGLKYHIEHTHPNLIAALRAHQSGLIHHPLLVNAATSGAPEGDGHAVLLNNTTQATAAMTIAAALQAIDSSPMMAAATTAIMTAQANHSNNNNNNNSNNGGTPLASLGAKADSNMDSSKCSRAVQNGSVHTSSTQSAFSSTPVPIAPHVPVIHPSVRTQGATSVSFSGAEALV